MALLDRIKSLFVRPDLPEETRRLFETARSTRELLHGLDRLLTHNEVELNELDRELAKLEALERSEAAKVRAGVVDGRRKKSVLFQIQRLRRQMDLYEQRQRIYRHNINLHLQLIGKIQEMEAMKLRGVDDKQIEEIALRFEESREKFEEAMHAVATLDTSMELGAEREDRELEALEAELLGEAGAAEGESAQCGREPAAELAPPAAELARPVRELAPPAGEAAPPAERAAQQGDAIEREIERGEPAPAPPRREPTEEVRERRLELE
ncbi:MAG: hypothetical protein KatS3mg102_0235 [Planctomycetota bacterium]|nr:MAG: hypothetical protein KatS3mg102_0235 [Planctomycetota bacterium]